MRATTITVGPLVAASANNIALTQTPTVGALTLNGSTVTGGVATLDQPRRILITTTGNESTKTFTVTGTDVNGSPITEVLTGANIGTTQSNLDFKTVTSIVISANAAAPLTVGTDTVASSRWMRLDEWAPAPTGFQCTVTGTVNYTVQGTFQDPNSPTNPVLASQVIWYPNQDPNVSGATATSNSFWNNPPLWMRVLLNSGTGSVSTVVAQNSAVPR